MLGKAYVPRRPTASFRFLIRRVYRCSPGAIPPATYFARNGYTMATFGKIWHPRNREVTPDEPLPETPQPWFTPAQGARPQAEDPAHWDRGLDAKIADSANAELEKRTTASNHFF